MTNQMRWVYGTRTEQWYLVSRQDRDFVYGITESEMDKIGPEAAKAKYLSSSIIGLNMHTQLITTELSNLGFTTRITQTGVLVGLNRPVSRMEIETALEQVVEGVKFNIYPVSKNTQHVITEE